MVDYREILRLYVIGISQRNITVSCACSIQIVSAILNQTKAYHSVIRRRMWGLLVAYDFMFMTIPFFERHQTV